MKNGSVCKREIRVPPKKTAVLEKDSRNKWICMEYVIIIIT